MANERTQMDARQVRDDILWVVNRLQFLHDVFGATREVDLTENGLSGLIRIIDNARDDLQAVADAEIVAVRENATA